VSNLSSKLDKQANELSKLPATGNKEQVARALRDILFIYLFHSLQCGALITREKKKNYVGVLPQ
jgi:hypothetical protein